MVLYQHSKYVQTTGWCSLGSSLDQSYSVSRCSSLRYGLCMTMPGRTLVTWVSSPRAPTFWFHAALGTTTLSKGRGITGWFVLHTHIHGRPLGTVLLLLSLDTHIDHSRSIMGQGYLQARTTSISCAPGSTEGLSGPHLPGSSRWWVRLAEDGM